MQNVLNYQELKQIVKSNKHVYCLIFQPDKDVSVCANQKLNQVAKKAKDGLFCTVDVNQVRDIHTQYNVTTAPTLLVFNQGKIYNQVKGCNDVSFYENLFNGNYFTSSSSDAETMHVTVYTSSNCTYCNALKSYLRERKVNFTEIDISKDVSHTEFLIQRTGQRGVPQTNINGTFVVGFDQRKLNQLLEIK